MMADHSEMLTDIAGATGLSSDQCEALAGTLIGAFQTSLPAGQFGEIEKVIPNTRALAAKSTAPLSGRTGEIAAIMSQLKTPEGGDKLAEQLTRKGLTAEQVRRGADAMVRFLQGKMGNRAVEGLLGTLPGLQRLMS